MRKVVLTMIEERKYNIIKKLVDNNSNKHRAASKLKCSLRHINRLIILYKTKGKDGFVHGNTNRKPISSFSCDTNNKVVNLFKDSFSNCNITHFSEILIEDYNISVSDSTIHKWLKEELLVSCKARKSTKKIIKKKLYSTLKTSSSNKEKNNIVHLIETLDYNDAHPRCPRSKY